MKILLLAQGIATHTQRFIKMLLAAGHEVVEVDVTNPFPDGLPGYQFIPYPATTLKKVKPEKLRRALRAQVEIFHLWQIWRRTRPDVTHVLSIHDSAYYCACAGMKPLILTAWGVDINHLLPLGSRPEWYTRRIAYALTAADYVTGDTGLLLKRSEQVAGRSIPTSLFYFGIDIKIFEEQDKNRMAELRRTLQIPAGTKVVLSIRKLNRGMNQHIILQAFAEAIQQINDNAVLVFRRIFIDSKKYELEILDLAKDLGVQEKIIWAEQMDYENLPALYQTADVIVNFPESDGFPVSLFEAAASRTLTITCDLPDYQEILDAGAFLRVAPGNIKGLAATLKAALTDSVSDKAERIEQNAVLVKKIADQQKSLADIERLYRAVLENSRR